LALVVAIFAGISVKLRRMLALGVALRACAAARGLHSKGKGIGGETRAMPSPAGKESGKKIPPHQTAPQSTPKGNK